MTTPKKTNKPKPSPAESGAFFIASIAITQTIWVISFNIGAYGDVFFEHLFMVWVASITALLARLVIGRTENGKRYFGGYGTLFLLAPSLWITTELLTFGNTHVAVEWFRYILTFLTISMALPYIGFIIVNMALPQVAEIKHPRLRIGLIFIAIFTALLAFIVGANNNYVMSCSDFQVAGSSLPINCYQESMPQ